MKRFFATLIFSMSFGAPLSVFSADVERSPIAEQVPSPASIKVRLFSFTDSLELHGVGVQTPRKSPPSIVGVALPQGEQLRVSLQYKNKTPVWSVLRSKSSVAEVFAGSSLDLASQEFKRNGQTLPRRLKLWAQGPRVDVVAEIPLEDYLLGVVASEMPSSWPLETLKAQAVAARSYAMSMMRERARQPFHVDSTILDQVYRHMTQGEAQSAKMAKVQEAVRSTAGQYLVVGPPINRINKINRPLKAFFHSDCGGKTTTPQKVWSGGVNAGQATDNSCPTSPQGSWKLKISRSDLEKKLKVRGLQDIQLLSHVGDERVHQVKIVAESVQTLTSNRFRELIGYQILKSALFDLSQDESGFVFTGRGFGHGVGLCQWGSRHLGRQGLGYKQILEHYYPLARLQSTKL